jgi:cobalt/nickel transport protein
MRKIGIFIAVISVCVALAFMLSTHKVEWTGVDDSVVGKFAEAAGRPPTDPYINIAKGDLELFFFLLAGVVGGFTAGYYYRVLFSGVPEVTGPSDDV